MKQEQIQYIPLDRLTFRSQVREHANGESLYELADSISAVGMLHPIRARMENGAMIPTDGERRARAAGLLGWKEVPVIIEERLLNAAEVIQVSLISNCQREDLTSLEKARGIQELMAATGWNASEAAKNLGFSNATVSRLLAILSLPEAIQQQVADGAIAASTAYEIAKVDHPGKQQQMAEAAANGALTRDEAATASKLDLPVQAEPAALSRVRAVVRDGAVTVSGPSLTAESVVVMLTELVARIRKLKASGMGLEELTKALGRTNKRTPKGAM